MNRTGRVGTAQLSQSLTPKACLMLAVARPIVEWNPSNAFDQCAGSASYYFGRLLRTKQAPEKGERRKAGEKQGEPEKEGQRERKGGQRLTH